MRAWVIGNGPSLKNTNLDLLDGEVTFACNRINLLYNKTSWRPSHYIRVEGMELLNEPDPSIWREDFETHMDMVGCTVWANLYFINKLGIKPPTNKFQVIRSCAHYTAHYDDSNCPHQWHMPIYCTFGSSVNVAIQIAYKLKYNPIYLVGCDLGYKDGEPSHFTDEYEEGYWDMLRPAKYANLDTLAAHMQAARTVPKGTILNATKGGFLEVYDRVDYESLFT